MNKKMIISVMIILIVVLGSYGVTKLVNSNNSKGDLTISHKLGDTVVKSEPSKVLVFDYGIADALEVLDVKVTGLPKSNLPDLLSTYEDEKYIDVGTLKEPNMEKVYELKPDLIIISARLEEYYEEFSSIAPTIYLGIDNKDYIGSFKNNMEILGEIFNKEKKVADEVKKVEEEIAKVNKKAAGVNGLVTLANDGTFSVYGEESRFGIIHREFGIEPIDKSIGASTHGQKATFEYVLDKNPEYIFVVDRAAVTGGTTSAENLFNNEIIKKTKAYENDNIIYLNPEVWYTVSGGIGSTKIMVKEISKAIE